MKTFAPPRIVGTALILLAGACPFVHADEPGEASEANKQRAVISESRRTETQRLDVLAKDCERKFAVTRCLDQVHTERLEIEGKLNRQEAVLNDAQRLALGREQEARNLEKAAARAQKMANLVNAPTPQARQPKLKAQPTAAAKQGRSAEAKEPALSAQERIALAKDYQRKQVDAIAKRAEVAKRLKDAGAQKPSLPKPD